jgi:hypothetical protein
MQCCDWGPVDDGKAEFADYSAKSDRGASPQNLMGFIWPA